MSKFADGMTKISDLKDTIDSREVIARVDELERRKDEAEHGDEGADGLDEDEEKELAALKKLCDEADGCSDWLHGETLVRDSYFEEYAQEFAADVTEGMKQSGDWPFRHIDWKAAAKELQDDYTPVDFDGTTYWIRS